MIRRRRSVRRKMIKNQNQKIKNQNQLRDNERNRCGAFRIQKPEK